MITISTNLKQDQEDSLNIHVLHMVGKLQVNNKKGDWNNCTTEYLLNRMKEEIVELEEVLKTRNQINIKNECADISNFAMMISDSRRFIKAGV